MCILTRARFAELAAVRSDYMRRLLVLALHAASYPAGEEPDGLDVAATLRYTAGLQEQSAELYRQDRQFRGLKDGT